VYQVDCLLSADNAANFQYCTIQGAVNAARSNSQSGYPNRYAVIEVKPGIYHESIIVSDVELLLLADQNNPQRMPVAISAASISTVLSLNSPVVVDGFIISHESGVQGGGYFWEAVVPPKIAS
jgi:pectin methylesterase-like acyl-CoA thioesterase